MNMINLLIVDDEPLAHKVLERYCKKIDYIKLVGNCYDSMSTFNFLNKNQVDIVLLDIQMPDLTGIELLETLQNNSPKIIFTTAFSDFALQSFDYDQVIDYLLKPIRLSRFIKAIERGKTQLQLERALHSNKVNNQHILPAQTEEFINLRDNKIIYKVRIEDIIYVQSWGNYLKIFLLNGEVKIIRKTIKAIGEELPQSQFERIHKSYLININKVVAIEGNYVVMKNARLPIGKSYLMKAKSRLTG